MKLKQVWRSRVPFLWRRVGIVLLDVLSWVLAFLVVSLVLYDLTLTSVQWEQSLLYLGVGILLFVAGGFASQIYLGRTHLGSFHDCLWVGSIAILDCVVLLMLLFVLKSVPRGMALALPLLALVFLLAWRTMWRAIDATRQTHRAGSRHAQRALVYGAGVIGHEVINLSDIAKETPYNIVGLIDDNPSKRFLRINGRKILGTGTDLGKISKRLRVETVIFAISAPPASLIQEVSRECQAAGLTLVVVPPVREMIGGHVRLGQLRKADVADLLGRRPIETDINAISGYIRDKVVLITGAGGSIGSELSRQVLSLGPSKLVLLDRDETALHTVQLDLYGSGLLDSDEIVLCDIRDREALQAIFDHHQPEVVFHTAALKHLPMLERFPLEGWKTNVLGSNNVLHCAKNVGVQRFVNISTDKAADPTSVLGQTKRLAERLTACYAKVTGLPYVSVRFGNVLGSRGSVLYTFRSQIARGGPVTVTHPDVTRFFMTIPEACQLVLQAGSIGHPGDVMVLDMGQPVRIVDVAQLLIAESGKDLEIVYTGLRPGEKLHEVLFSQREDCTPSEHPLISRNYVPPLCPDELPVDDSHPLDTMIRQGALNNPEQELVA
jgi:dTDP-glucose 4,6-dehydratase